MFDIFFLLFKMDFLVINCCKLEMFQVNFGYCCNQFCIYCYVVVSLKWMEEMSWEMMVMLFVFVVWYDIQIFDLIGGVFELNFNFWCFVIEVWVMGLKVIDCCNLIILSELGYEILVDFLVGQ